MIAPNVTFASNVIAFGNPKNYGFLKMLICVACGNGQFCLQ